MLELLMPMAFMYWMKGTSGSPAEVRASATCVLSAITVREWDA